MISASLSPGRTSRCDVKSGTYDVYKIGEHHGIVDVEIILHNDSEGLDDLMGCVLALSEQEFLSLLHRNHVGVEDNGLVSAVEDISEYDDERIWYKHRVICRFHCKFGYKHLRTNEVVTAVVLDDPFDLE